MNLAIFLSFTETMDIMKKAGQDGRFLEYYLKPYGEAFEHIYIFTWGNETYAFPFPNITLVPNAHNTNPYLYNFTLPFAHADMLKKCLVLRLMQFTPIIPAVIAKLKFKNKIIATYGFPYGRSLAVKGRYLKSFLWKIVEKITLKKTDKFIVTSRKNKDFLLENGVNAKKIHLSPNGVDTDVFRPVLRNKNSEILSLLFVGRFNVEKNMENLAQALVLSEHKNKFKITFIGSGELQDSMEKILKAGGIKFEIIPTLPHKEVLKHYQQADIFLLPSLTEGYPKVLIEAMACGVACIVGKYKGHESIAKDGENALVCGFGAEDIAKKIDTLAVNSGLREKLSRNARTFTEEHNNIKKIVQKEIALITELAHASNV